MCLAKTKLTSLYQYHLNMKLVPQNKNVVCRCISSNEKTTESGFVYTSNDVPLYEVVSIAKKAKCQLLKKQKMTFASILETSYEQIQLAPKLK